MYIELLFIIEAVNMFKNTLYIFYEHTYRNNYTHKLMYYFMWISVKSRGKRRGY